MDKLKVAVCDSCERYVSALVRYMSEKYRAEILASGFTSTAPLLGYLEKTGADVILVEEGLWSKELDETKAQVIVLCDGRGALPEGVVTVEKYQAADEIVRQIYATYEPPKGSGGQIDITAGTRLICVYSPGHALGQTAFAATLSMCLNRQLRSLYVNLKENAAFDEIFDKEYQKDVSDMIYLSDKKRDSFRNMLSGTVEKDQDLTYIPPMEMAVDAVLLSREKWLNFLNLLANESGYDCVILDICGMLPIFYEILEASARIYVPLQDHEYGKARGRKFEKDLKKRQLEGVLEKLRRIKIPQMKELYEGDDLLNGWIWGDMGEYVRRLLDEDDPL